MIAVDLYSGAGGSALGIARAGFDQIIAFEIDAEKVNTINLNREVFAMMGCNMFATTADVFKLSLSDFPSSVDLLVGGAPCQPFSLSGKRKGFDDPRDGIARFFSFVSGVNPECFLLENVPGLLHGKFLESLCLCIANSFSASLDTIKDWLLHATCNDDCLRLGGYDLHALILNSSDFGLSQHRNRLFIFGFRSISNFKWLLPVATHSMNNLLRELFTESSDYRKKHSIVKIHVPARSKSFWIAHEQTIDEDPNKSRWSTVRDLLLEVGLPKQAKDQIGCFGHNLHRGARSYSGHTGSYLDWPAKTLKAGVHGVPGGENMLRWSNGRVRYFTLLECALLQGFPVTYQFLGGFKSIINSIGNAVPPILIEQILRSYYHQIQSHLEEVPPSNTIPILPFLNSSSRLKTTTG